MMKNFIGPDAFHTGLQVIRIIIRNYFIELKILELYVKWAKPLSGKVNPRRLKVKFFDQ